jgi:hypothetical protein
MAAFGLLSVICPMLFGRCLALVLCSYAAAEEESQVDLGDGVYDSLLSRRACGAVMQQTAVKSGLTYACDAHSRVFHFT